MHTPLQHLAAQYHAYVEYPEALICFCEKALTPYPYIFHQTPNHHVPN